VRYPPRVYAERVNARSDAAARDLDRAWLVRAVRVLFSPREVFAALRDDSRRAAHAREEPITALVILAGIAGVLWTPVAGTVMNDPAYDGLLVAVWAFIGGGFYGVAAYWTLGALLYGGARALGATASFRQARHVVAFAAAPIALSLLLVWPARLGVYGADLFKSGGADHGMGATAFVALELAFVAWSLALLALGVRIVYRSRTSPAGRASNSASSSSAIE
jgi:hypothetical protein